MRNEALRGKLLTIEGGDGSGKTDQVRLLFERLVGIGYQVRVWDFPQYGESYYGKMVGRMLRGEFGELMSIHPTLAAMVFANDRLSVRDEMGDWLVNGGVALCNRYVDSNLAHGAAKFSSDKEAIAFMDEIELLEYEANHLPVPDICFYVVTDAELSRKMVLSKGERQYMEGGVGADQAESNLGHQERAREMYVYLCKTRPRFVRIDCMKGLGELESREVIHERIWGQLVARRWV